MFQYAVDVFAFSDAEAYVRIAAARAARRFPAILDLVASGTLSVTTIRFLAPHLTEENCAAVLGAVSGKSTRAVELELARRFPKPDAPQVLRKLPVAKRAEATPDAPALFTKVESPATPAPGVAPNSSRDALPVRAPALARPTTATQPLSASRYKLQVTLSEGTQAKLRQAQQLLRHQVPDGDLAEVLDRALDALVREQMKRQFAATERPRAKSGSKAPPGSGRQSRRIPSPVRREVVARDGLRCSYTDNSGSRCEETGFLQLHHVEPFEKGGEHSAGNIRVFCRSHNLHAAEEDYGAAHMDQYKQPRMPPEFVRESRVTYCAGGLRQDWSRRQPRGS